MAALCAGLPVKIDKNVIATVRRAYYISIKHTRQPARRIKFVFGRNFLFIVSLSYYMYMQSKRLFIYNHTKKTVYYLLLDSIFISKIIAV